MRYTTSERCSSVRAVVQSGYGEPDEVLSVENVPPPDIAADEVLVRVRAASLHPDVWHVVTGRPYVLRLMGAGVRAPKQRIPGTDVAGIVQAVGAGVTRFRVGDEVFGETTKRIQWANAGAFAELAAAPEEALALKPAGVGFEEAAAVPTSGIIAYATLRELDRVGPGKRVLVNGAAGGVGMFVVQLAKARGAHVTAVDLSPKLDLLRSIGADVVLDGREDYTRTDARYDVVLDIIGNRPFSSARRIIATGGAYALVGHDQYGAVGRRVLGSMPKVFRLVALSPFVKELPKPVFSWPDKRQAMEELRALMEANKLRAVVERAYRFDEVIAAFARLQSGQVKGKLVLTPDPGEPRN